MECEVSLSSSFDRHYLQTDEKTTYNIRLYGKLLKHMPFSNFLIFIHCVCVFHHT